MSGTRISLFRDKKYNGVEDLVEKLETPSNRRSSRVNLMLKIILKFLWLNIYKLTWIL